MAIGTTAAIIAGSAIAGGASIYGSSKAASAQASAADAATAEQRRQFDIALKLGQPYRQAGYSALKGINALLGTGGGTNAQFRALKQTPGYKFTRAEGIRGIEQSAAARGGALSGNALRGITEYNSKLANLTFGDAFNRYATVAGLGQTSAQAGANAALMTGQNIGQNYLAAGDARASGYYGMAGGVNNAIQGGLSNYLLYDYLKRQPAPVMGG